LSLEVFFFPAEDGIRAGHVTGVQTCALPLCDAAVPAGGDDRAGLYVPEHPAQLPLLVRGIERGRDQTRPYQGQKQDQQLGAVGRSEERRVGKEGRWRWGT